MSKEEYSLKILINNNNLKILKQYFFNIIDQLTYEKKLNYFINNSILSKYYDKNYYFFIPKKFLTNIYQSTLKEIKFTNNIYIKKDIWDKTYMNNLKIDNIKQKKEIFLNYNNYLENFINKFNHLNVFTYEDILLLSKDFTTNYINSKLDKSNNYILLNLLDDITLLNYNSDENSFSHINNNVSYSNILKNFIKNSIQFFNILNLNDSEHFFKNNEEIILIQNIRIELSRFYSIVILKIIIEDIFKFIYNYLKNIH